MQNPNTVRGHRAIGIALALLALAAPAQAPKDKGAGGPAQGVPVKVSPVRVAAVANEVSAVGSLIADESVMMRPEVAGRVQAILFSEGQAVAKGARLVELDAAEIQAQLAGSTSDVRLAQARAERAEQLFGKNFISQQSLDDAREALRKASARRQEDEVRLAKMEVRAPFAGYVGLRLVSPGAYVKAGDDLVRLDAIDVVKLDFRIPEVYVAQLRKDQPVQVRVDAFPGQQYSGRVYAVDTALDEKTRTVLLRARISNPGARLRPGMFARVTLPFASRQKAIIVPEQALVPRGGKTFVFRVVGGKAVLTPVETGARNPGEVDISSGLDPHDVVVTDGQLRLQDGAAVKVMAEKTPASKG